MYRQQGFPGGGPYPGAFGPGQGGFGPGPGGGGPGGRPPGPPGGNPGFGPGQPPFGAGQLPPPPLAPPGNQGPSLTAVDPGSFWGCLYRYTWVRLNNGRSFWFYPTFIGRTSVAGFRWNRIQRQWFYTGLDTRQISSFQCQ